MTIIAIAIAIAIVWAMISSTLILSYFSANHDLCEKELFVSLAWPIVGLRYIFRGAKEWYNDD